MASQVLGALAAQVQANVDAEASAIIVLNSIAQRVQSAVDTALANGATEAELAPVIEQVNALKSSADALGAAIVANTPSAP